MSTTVLPQDIANERANSLISYYFDKKNMKDELKKFKTQQLTNIIMQFMIKLIFTQRDIEITEEMKDKMEQAHSKIQALNSISPHKK